MNSDQFSSRPTRVKISLQALKNNFTAISSLVNPSQVMCVVKANAFGHGIIECSKELEQAGANWFGVALVEEGVLLRKSGIKARILVFGGIYDAQVDLFISHDLEITAPSVYKLNQINSVAEKLGKKATVHLEIDTGFGRTGVRPESAGEIFQAAKTCTWCDVVGIYSHFSSAEDENDTEFTNSQIKKFSTILTEAKNKLNENILAHISNSAGIFLPNQTHFSLVRPGLALYGVYPSSTSHKVKLEPVLSLTSKVIYVKTVPPGTPISYNRTWISKEETRIVTLPLGYGDGYFRALSNKAQVLIRGKRYPIVGRICMDQMMVNVGKDSVFNGDDVVLIGKQGEEEITAEQLANLAGTIPYEIFTNLNDRLPREFG